MLEKGMQKVARRYLIGCLAASCLVGGGEIREIWVFSRGEDGERKRVQGLECQEYFLFLHVVNWRIVRRNSLIVSE